MSSNTQKPYSPASSRILCRFSSESVAPDGFWKSGTRYRKAGTSRSSAASSRSMLMPSSSNGARAVVAGLFCVDRSAGPDQIGRYKVLQLQRSVADQNLFRGDPVLRGQLLAQRRVATLLAVLQDNVRIFAHHRGETLPQLFFRERLGRRHPTGKAYHLARRHLTNPSFSVFGKAQSYLSPRDRRNRGLRGRLLMATQPSATTKLLS